MSGQVLALIFIFADLSIFGTLLATADQVPCEVRKRSRKP